MMKAQITTVYEYLAQNRHIFAIPLYQRSYQWGESQCRQLFADLEKVAATKQPHFIGAIVGVEETLNEVMGHKITVIDGQQRLTSCTLLLRALANHASGELAENISDEILCNKAIKNLNDGLKLQSVPQDQAAIKAVLLGRTLDDQTDSSNVIANFALFNQLVEASSYSVEELFNAMARLKLVVIQLSSSNDDENPQEIFESLNSTGMALTAPDLVRNFLLMQRPATVQAQLYEQYWQPLESYLTPEQFVKFLRSYLIMHTKKLVKESAVYQAYKDYFALNHLDAAAALADLVNYGKLYAQLEGEQTVNPEFNRSVQHLHMLKSHVFNPILLALLGRQAAGKITWEQVNQVAFLLETMVLRCLLCGKPTNGFNRLNLQLLAVKNSELVGGIRRILQSLNIPDDKELKQAVVTYPIYRRKKEVALLALIALEMSQTKEPIDFTNVQIEHIMPQHLSNEWQLTVANAVKVNATYGNTLGNLTLTKYNQEMSNKSYAEKSKVYATSNVLLTRAVAQNYATWGGAEITARSKALATQLMQLYPELKTTTAATKAAAGTYPVTANVEVTGTKPQALTVAGTTITVRTWKEVLVGMLNYILAHDPIVFKIVLAEPLINKKLYPDKAYSLCELDDGTTIETSFSAQSIMALVNEIANIAHLTEETTVTLGK